jgi:hypothetical protein
MELNCDIGKIVWGKCDWDMDNEILYMLLWYWTCLILSVIGVEGCEY